MNAITWVSLVFPQGDQPYVSIHRGDNVTTCVRDVSFERAELIHKLALRHPNLDYRPLTVVAAARRDGRNFVNIDFCKR